MNTRIESTSSKHIAGIVPVAAVRTDIDLVLPPSMLPIENGFYNVQRAILECAYVGCNTIWVVCSDSEAKLIQSVCGDFVMNMYDYERSMHSAMPGDNRKMIPIIYTPLSFKYQNKKGIILSMIEGVRASFHVSKSISKWMVPYKYYVANPYGVYSPEIDSIKTRIGGTANFFVKFDGRTAMDGENLGFCLGVDEAKHCSYLIKRIRGNRDFDLDIILDNDILRSNFDTYEVGKYHNIQNWKGYQDMWKDPLEIHSKYRLCFKAAFSKQERKLNE